MLSASVSVSAAKSVYEEETPVADVVMHCDEPNVAAGEIVVVNVSLENISLESGVIACDLPVFYNKDILELTLVEVVVPDFWNGNDKSLCNINAGDNYSWLRVIPERPEGSNLQYEDFAVKQDKGIMFNLIFTAKKAGNTTVTIKNDEKNKLYMMVVSPDIKNYRPNGASLKVRVSAYENSGWVEETEEPVEESVDYGNVSEEAGEASGAESAVTPQESQVIHDSASANVTTPDNGDEVEKDDDNGGSATKYIIIFAVIGAVAGGAIGAFVGMSKKKAKNNK